MDLFTYNQPRRVWSCKIEIEISEEDINRYLQRQEKKLTFKKLSKKEIKECIKNITYNKENKINYYYSGELKIKEITSKK